MTEIASKSKRSPAGETSPGERSGAQIEGPRAASLGRLRRSLGAAGGTGLPPGLKSGIETLSGLSMDDVTVQRNSSRPGRMQALAYAQGSEIHLAPGQDSHLAHEAWHVVQQKQGRVAATGRLAGGISLNDEPALEREADLMGRRALQLSTGGEAAVVERYHLGGRTVMQRVVRFDGEPIGTFAGLDVTVNSLGELRRDIDLAVGGYAATDDELDNATRAAMLDLPQSRNLDANLQRLTTALARKVRSNRKDRTGHEPRWLRAAAPDVADNLRKGLGANELERLNTLAALLWRSGRISVERIIGLLRHPGLIDTHLAAFLALIAHFAGNPLAMKLLGQMTPDAVERVCRNVPDRQAFDARVRGLNAAATDRGIDPLHVVEIDDADRFVHPAAAARGLNHDLDLVRADGDFNLRQDLAYIAELEGRFNQSASGPGPASQDSDRLRAEITRMKRIYRHKVEYLHIMRDMSAYFGRLDAEFAELDQRTDREIAELRGKRAVPLVFKSRATAGYRQKQIGKTERDYDTQIRQRGARRDDERARIARLKDQFSDRVAEFLDVGAHYRDLVIQAMRSGILMLPSDTRLAGIFPASQNVRISAAAKPRRHQILASRARSLLLENYLFNGQRRGRQGLLPLSRVGCVCIMYIKEGHGEAATYRPVFGASGKEPYGRAPPTDERAIDDKSYTDMGVPKPRHLHHAGAVGDLRKTMADMRRLNLKLPAVQSQLYFLQTPDYRSNMLPRTEQAPPELARQAGNGIGMLESWMPSNCAEPAIMTAIYQMYHAPLDIYLSVPFEGEVTPDGRMQLKYTCTRCAVSEPRFMSPTSGPEQLRLTDMHLGHGHEDYPHQRLGHDTLVFNDQNQRHPYRPKLEDARKTMVQNMAAGFRHVRRGAMHEEHAERIVQALKNAEKQAKPVRHRRRRRRRH